MRLKPAGERLPYTAIAIGLVMLGLYHGSSNPTAAPAAEILRDGPSPAAPWTRPSVDDLLAGRACIPMSILLENREIESVHSYSREVVCR